MGVYRGIYGSIYGNTWPLLSHTGPYGDIWNGESMEMQMFIHE